MPYTEMNIIKADVLAQIMRMVYTEKVREEKGGTYGVSVSADCNKRPEQDCRLTISFRCDPDKYAELLPIIHEQLQLMAEQGPTAEQMDKVKGYEQKNYDRIILTNGYWESVMSNLITDGINIDKDYMNMGFATEASAKMIEYGFSELGFKKINGMCMSINSPSRRVMEKLGMTYEGTLRKDLYKDGAFYDLDRLSILREEYYTIRKVENRVFNF